MNREAGAAQQSQGQGKSHYDESPTQTVTPRAASSTPTLLQCLIGFHPEACNAGAQPNRTAASKVATRVKSSTGTLSPTSASEGKVKGGMIAIISLITGIPTPTPATPPTVASARLSVRN